MSKKDTTKLETKKYNHVLLSPEQNLTELFQF